MRKRLFLFGLLCAGIHSQAQLTGFRREGDHIFEEALRSFEQQQNQHATDVLHQKNTLPYGREVSKQSIVWQWERALEYRAALRNRQTHAIGHLIQFAEQCQVLAIRSVLNMEAGRYYFRNGQYREAITCLEKTGIEYLTNTELVEKNFELGYSYLVIGRFDKVEPYFQTAKNIPGDFFKPGNYYHGLLSYYRGDYTAARSSFQAVAHDEPYQNLVPYYLIEMDYLEGHTNKALQDALQQLDAKGNLYYTRELKLLVATLYTDQKDYARAIPYYRDYLQAGDDSGASMENRFKLAWCLWKEKQESEALQILESLNGMPEALNTERGLMLASGYLKEKNMDRFESSIRELKADSNDVSMQAWLSFTRAQLASQQNKKEVTDMLEEHLSMFPSSPYTEQVHEMLSVWYIRESRFEEAARQMNELNQISVGLLTYYQQAMYRKAMDLLKQGEAEQAIPFFEEARKFSEDPAIPVLSDFWLSEACFRNQLYADANLAADRFLDAADNRTWPAYIQQAHLLKCFIFRQANDTANMLQQYQLAVHDTTSFHDTSFLFSLNRSLFQPDTLPEFNSYPITYSYEVPEHEVKVRYQPIPLKPLALQSKEEGKHLPSSFSLQAGNRRATDLQAHLNLDALLKWPLQVYVQHERITEVPNERQFRHTALQALSSYLLMDHEARFRVDFSNDAFRYWGMLGSETASARSFHTAAYRKMDAQLELLPLKPNIYQIDYQARIQNGLFFNRNGSTEYRLALETPARKVWNESTVFYA
ncbi:MAG TPA: tetratricopeptide repeat protein, partial [Chitinophagaceae bacterium]|nr:tetratricopeptide repeat protein [Chitinophagaceae bacterium]